MNSDQLYANILERHKGWKIFLKVVLILTIIIMVLGTIFGLMVQDFAQEHDLEEPDSIIRISMYYFWASLLLCCLLTFLTFLLYNLHIKKIPEIRDYSLNKIFKDYWIVLVIICVLFFNIWLAFCMMPFVIITIIIITNIELIKHSKRIERTIEEIYKVRSYHAHQASSIHHQLESQTKYCSTCQYPLKYVKINDRYYCEVCNKFDQ